MDRWPWVNEDGSIQPFSPEEQCIAIESERDSNLHEIYIRPLTNEDCYLAGVAGYLPATDKWIAWGNWADRIRFVGVDRKAACNLFFQGWITAQQRWDQERLQG